jgi:hypothetical protein
MPGVMPYWLPFALYYVGMLNLNGRENLAEARRLLAASHASIAQALRIGLAAEVTLYWMAVMHEGIARSAMNDCASAVPLFDRLIAAGDRMPAELWQAELRPELISRAHVQRGVAWTRLGEAEKAARDFESALQSGELLPPAERELAKRLLGEVRSWNSLFGRIPRRSGERLRL